ncbi:hypothetical protein BGW42_005995 [Actinomortierella wolfii]|nr:hypothetical protein BGW42_005995 [Actinomortierella wolfii]
MKLVSTIAVAFAIIVGTLTLSLALESSTFAVKDATTIYYKWGARCRHCKDGLCSYCPHGKGSSLGVWKVLHSIASALVGFILPDGALTPSSEIIACSIQFPPFTTATPHSAKIAVFLAESSNWDEDTVSGLSRPGTEKFPLAVIEVPANASLGPIDVTSACKKAKNSADGQFSILLRTDTGIYSMESRESGYPAVLKVTYQ